MLKRWMCIGLLAMGLGHALPAAAQEPSYYVGQTRLVNADWTARKGPTGGQCIDVPYGTKALGTVLQMHPCNSALTPNQAFRLKDRELVNSRISVYAGSEERCIGFEDEGGKVNLTDCAKAPRWTLRETGQIATADLRSCIRIPDSGVLEVIDNCNPGDARTIFGSEWQMSTLVHDAGPFVLASVQYAVEGCLDIRGGSMAPGASTMWYGCHFGQNQAFNFLSTKTGKLFLTVYRDGYMLCITNVPGGGGDWTQAVPCNPWDEKQEWRKTFPASGGALSFLLVNVASGRCLDAYKPHRHVGAWFCHGGLNQQWLDFEF